MTGTVLASRYQIVTHLGHGGMGEVYRADDLKLNQPVALKFLSRAQAADAAALARLHQEVRLARQISHPAVCRVFDLGEVRDQSFLCMELIDGEDLASLLRRIGRLPVDKALEISCQLAVGLAAIHDGGLLHRDLKPANVMIDGRGRARITDFGLAVPAGTPSDGWRAGTPAYMAPEHRLRNEVSVQSDLYSLGLVICEMLTGRPFCVEDGDPERPALQALATVEIDARMKAALLRCLEPDPKRRPPSALHVLAAFTGQDPLSLAVAHGLTVSPEAVAAAPRIGSLRPAVAVALLAATLTCLAAVVVLAGRIQAFQQTPSDLPPDVLTERARSLLHQFAATGPPRDWASGFLVDAAYSRYLATGRASGESRRLLATGRPPLYLFWYRTSPRLLETDSNVTPFDPPRESPGEAYLEIDLAGRLCYLEVSPLSDDSGERANIQPDWPSLLRAAGFDAAQVKTLPPRSVPPVYADNRAAWEGSYSSDPSQPALPVRIEAAALHGVPVWLDVTGPWNRDFRRSPKGNHATMPLAIRFVFEATVLLSGFLLARRNLRLGRGDLKGAFRLAVLAFSLSLVSLLNDAGHSRFQIETSYYNQQLGVALQTGLLFWACYLGFEPSFRRRWPDRIISWNRALAGRFRDPLVGRDVLAGCALGLGKAVLGYAKELPQNLSLERPWTGYLSGSLLTPMRHLHDPLFYGLFFSLELMLLLLALRILLRREGLALAVLWVLLTWGMALPGPYTALNLACSGLGSMLLVIAYIRFGPLAGTLVWVTYNLCLHYPLTLDTSLWYASSGLVAVLVIVSLALYGFVTSAAGQPWLAHGVLDE